MELRNIEVGDNLSNKLLYFDFDGLSYADLDGIYQSSNAVIIRGTRHPIGYNHTINVTSRTNQGVSTRLIKRGEYDADGHDIGKVLYEIKPDGEVITNLSKDRTGSLFGLVTEIDTDNVVYNRITADIRQHEKVYCFCENGCKEETYTKEQIDELINNLRNELGS